MAIGYTNTQYYSAIANAIREKTKTTNQLRPSEMAPAILSIKSGGGGASESTDPEELYAATRPTDWLTMPTESEINDDELYLLFHIPDGSSAPIAFNVNCTGSYTVSLLTSESRTEVSSTTVSSGQNYQAQLSSSDFGDLTSNGMKQALIKISGTSITQWSIQEYSKNYSMGNHALDWNIVEVAGKLTKLTKFICSKKSNYSDSYVRYTSTLLKLKYFTLYGSNQITDASNMFRACKSLMLIRHLDTSNITNMSYMFSECSVLQAIPQFNTSSATNMSYMFSNAGSNAPIFSLNLSGWDISKVTNMSNMFASAGYTTKIFNLDLSSWNMSSVTDMSYMFSSAGACSTTFILNVLGLDTSKVTTMESMFASAGRSAASWSINGLSSWNVSNVHSMYRMFNYACHDCTNPFELDLSSWNTQYVSTTAYMFESMCVSVPSFSLNLSGWNVANITRTENMFHNTGANATTFNVNLTGWSAPKTTNTSYMFNNAGYSATSWSIGDLSNFNASSVTNMSYMFQNAGYNATSWTIGDISNWNTANVTDMSSMFSSAGRNAASWSIGNLSSWNTSNVTNMSDMFGYVGQNATTFKLNLSNWDVSKVTNMSVMFAEIALSATSWEVGDISNWNTSNVTDMSYMFKKACYNAEEVSIGNLANWDASKVTNMMYMFSDVGANALSPFEFNLLNWDTSKVTDMSYMFDGCTRLSKIYVSDLWNTDSVTSSDDMFAYCNSLVGGNGTAYNYSYRDKTYARIDTPETPGYFSTRTYNVTLKYMDNATADATITASSVKKLPIPTRTGYAFNGWYTGSEGVGNAVLTQTSFVSDSTYKWTYNSTSDEWESTGNKGVNNSVSVLKTVEFNAKAGDQLSFQWRSYTYGEKNYDYAAWNIWDVNNSKWLSGASSWGTTYSNSTTGLTPTSGVATTKGTSSSSEYITNTYKFTADGTYKIYWTYRKDAVSYGGTDLAYVKTVNVPGQTTLIISETPVNTLSDGLTLYAKWDLASYTIHYQLNGGTGVSDGIYTVEEEIILPTPTKTDYVFEGWYETADFSGSAVTTIPQGSTGDKTFYAKWYDNYTITYETNGGTLPSDAKMFYSSGASYTLPTPTKTDYVLGGWYETTDFSGTPITTIPQGSTGNKIFYAKWVEPSYILKTGEKFSRLIPYSTTSIVFTDTVKPASATAIDVSVDGSVVAWLDGTIFKISSQKAGQKIFFNENCDYMFCGNSGYCQALRKGIQIEFTNVDTSKVTSMVSMFELYSYDNRVDLLDLSGWDVSNVTQMQRMFYDARRVYELNLSGWDVSKVTNMSYMFYGYARELGDSINGLSNWNTANVTDMSYMFCLCLYKTSSSFDIDLSNWNTSNVTNMKGMFMNAGYYATRSWSIGDISGWNTSNVTDMSSMFNSAGSRATYSLNLSGWNVNSVTSYTDFNKGVTSKITPPVWVH